MERNNIEWIQSKPLTKAIKQWKATLITKPLCSIIYVPLSTHIHCTCTHKQMCMRLCAHISTFISSVKEPPLTGFIPPPAINHNSHHCGSNYSEPRSAVIPPPHSSLAALALPQRRGFGTFLPQEDRIFFPSPLWLKVRRCSFQRSDSVIQIQFTVFLWLPSEGAHGKASAKRGFSVQHA